RVVQLEVAVHLVGGDVVQPGAVAAHRLEDGEGADDVGVDERPRVRQGVVVVRLRGEVDDDVRGGDQRVDDVPVGHVPLDQLDVQPGEGLTVAGVGELVEHRHPGVGTVLEGLPDEVGADEPGAPGDEHVHVATPLVPAGCPQSPSRAAHAVVGPACGAPLLGVEDVAAVDDGGPVGQVDDGGGVQVAELAPLGEEQDEVGAGDGLFGGVGDGEVGAVLGGEDGAGLGAGDGDVGALGGQAGGDVQGGGVAHVAGVRRERRAQDWDVRAGDVAVDEGGDQGDDGVAAAVVDGVDLAQEAGCLPHAELLGAGHEGADVLGQAAAAEADPGTEELLADAVVVAEGLGELDDVGASGLAQLGHGVDEGDLGGQEGVGGDLDQVGGGVVGQQSGDLLAVDEVVVDLVQHRAADLGGLLVAGQAVDHAVGGDGVLHREALAQ